MVEQAQVGQVAAAETEVVWEVLAGQYVRSTRMKREVELLLRTCRQSMRRNASCCDPSSHLDVSLVVLMQQQQHGKLDHCHRRRLCTDWFG